MVGRGEYPGGRLRYLGLDEKGKENVNANGVNWLASRELIT